VRDSIRKLKKEGKTIFLCTHNLDEAERLCDRIAIINRRIMNVGTPQKLKYSAYGRHIVIRLERLSDRITDLISGMGTVKHVESKGNNLVLEVKDPEANNADIINNIVGAGGRIQFVSEMRHTLEDAYIKLVGETLEH